MKVKFNRERLVAALRKSKADAFDLYKKETRLYHEKHEKAKLKYIANTEKFLSELRNGWDGDPDRYRLSDKLEKGCDFPSKPHKPRMEQVEALIQQLELSDDEVVVCDTKEEYIQLTRACAILGTCKV